MARINILNDFQSVAAMQKSLAVLLPKPDEWRLLQPALVGQINALPETRGLALATNGIHVLILQENKQCFGHIDWFVADEDQPVKDLTVTAKTVKEPKKATKKVVDMMEFV